MKTFFKRVKRFILYSSAVLFFVVLYIAYADLAPMFDSKAGRAASWSAGMVLRPAAESVPLWAWGIMVGVAVYLWMKHKLIMSLVYGAGLGVWLAVMV